MSVTEGFSRLYDFTRKYRSLYAQGLEVVDVLELNRAVEMLKLCSANACSIFVGGNGGSASISNHLCCDFLKTADHKDFQPLRPFSLSANPSILTAIANDISYEETLSYQIERLATRSLDVVILISSSGNSPNIVMAAKRAKEIGVKVIGLTGFQGGKLRDLADVKLHVPVDNYGVVEDVHQSLMHIMAQFIRSERELECLPVT